MPNQASHWGEQLSMTAISVLKSLAKLQSEQKPAQNLTNLTQIDFDLAKQQSVQIWPHHTQQN